MLLQPYIITLAATKDSEGLQGTYRGVYDYNTFTTDEAIILFVVVTGMTEVLDDLYTHNWAEDSKPLYDTWKYYIR